MYVCLLLCRRHYVSCTTSVDRVTSVYCRPTYNNLSITASSSRSCYIRPPMKVSFDWYKTTFHSLILHSDIVIYSFISGMHQLAVPLFNLSTVGKGAFPVSGATFWNSLPPHVASAWLLGHLICYTAFNCGPCNNFCYLGHTKKSRWWWWVCSAKRRHHSPEWMILSHVNCFVQGEVQWFQVLLGSLHPRSTGASRWSPVLQRGSCKGPLGSWEIVNCFNMN